MFTYEADRSSLSDGSDAGGIAIVEVGLTRSKTTDLLLKSDGAIILALLACFSRQVRLKRKPPLFFGPSRPSVSNSTPKALLSSWPDSSWLSFRFAEVSEERLCAASHSGRVVYSQFSFKPCLIPVRLLGNFHVQSSFAAYSPFAVVSCRREGDPTFKEGTPLAETRCSEEK